MTNVKLCNGRDREKKIEEIINFSGIIILISSFEFCDRRSLWATANNDKYITAPKFGHIMARKIFEILCTCFRFSRYSSSEKDNKKTARWSQVQDFFMAINNHRRSFVTPSEIICACKIMSRVYGLGGNWNYTGSSHYVALDRKLEIGYAIHPIACGRIRIML